LRKKRNRLRVPVQNEYRCIEYSTERIEGVCIGRLRDAERGEACLHSRGGITQQIKIFHCASSVADLQLNTMACKYPCILPGKVVVPGSYHPGSDCEVTWW
jgi:hypothetical protein